MKFLTHALAPLAVAVCCSVASAVAPSAAIFNTTSHDFGTVARAAKAEFRFELTNPFDQPIHIRGVRASCGCTTPIVENQTIPPGQKGAIVARFNTGSFTGKRSATLTVTFDQPSFTEVQLQVKGYIRSDLVFSPGEANFGTVEKGQPQTTELTVDYAGRGDWAIVGLQTTDDFIKARAEESRRENWRVAYKLQIELSPAAPIGPLMSEVIIQTNDRNLKTVPLLVVANVEPGIAVSPRSIEVARTEDGQPQQQVLVLKGRSPFKITDVTSDVFEVKFEASGEEKAVHTLPLSLSPMARGESSGSITIHTNSDAYPTIEVEASYR